MADALPENFVHGQLYEFDVDQLETDPNQPRKYFDDVALESLGKSITKNGVLQPILFRKDEESGKLIIVAGERRLAATLKENIPKIPGIYFDGDHEAAALVENFCREDLTPIEQAEAFKQYKEKKNCENEVIASLFGKGVSTISEIISLNDLPNEIKNICKERPDIPRRELLKIKRVSNAGRQKERFDALVARYDNIGDGTSNRLTRRHKVVIVEEMIDRLIQKLKNVREGNNSWADEDRAGLRDKIIALKEELENHTVTDE
ncbi:MAG: ParB/RepB/Spo0J family partition protein [Candidatus Aenigmarchaeota archaeon]|nr:ParB/RepB/Spo0J family partition protein [Candidatus Aenigmarchaeota archaeon]